MPSSTICLTSSGVTTTSAASTTVRARKNAIGRRCGRAKPSTRRTVSRASFCSAMLRSVRMCRHTGPMPDAHRHLPTSRPCSSPARALHVSVPWSASWSLPIRAARSRNRRTCASRSASRCSSRSEDPCALQQGLGLGDRAVDRGRQRGGQVGHRVVELVARDDGRGQPDVAGLLGPDPPGGGTDLQGSRVANKRRPAVLFPSGPGPGPGAARASRSGRRRRAPAGRRPARAGSRRRPPAPRTAAMLTISGRRSQVKPSCQVAMLSAISGSGMSSSCRTHVSPSMPSGLSIRRSSPEENVSPAPRTTTTRTAGVSEAPMMRSACQVRGSGSSSWPGGSG